MLGFLRWWVWVFERLFIIKGKETSFRVIIWPWPRERKKNDSVGWLVLSVKQSAWFTSYDWDLRHSRHSHSLMLCFTPTITSNLISMIIPKKKKAFYQIIIFSLATSPQPNMYKHFFYSTIIFKWIDFLLSDIY